MGLYETLGLKPPRKPLEIPPAATEAEASAPTVVATSTAPIAPSDAGSARAGGEGAPATPPPDKNLAAFQTARAAAQKLVDDLNAHPQKAHVTTEIAQATAKLGEADTAAAAKDWSTAGKRLAEARTLCTTAKARADAWVAYRREYASMQALGMSFDAIGTADVAPKVKPILDQADALANATPPNFAAASKKLKEIATALQPWVRSFLDEQKKKLQAIEKMDKAVREFAKKDIDEAKTLVAEAERAFGAKDWSVCRENTIAARDVLGPGVRMGERRGAYDKQRAVTVAAIAKLRAVASVKSHADALDKRVAEADLLGSYENRKFEEGARVLVAAAQQAGVWAGLAKTVEACTKERAAAEAELGALDKHAAAARIAKERDAARQLLVVAANMQAGAEAAADPTAGYNAALTTVQRVRADLAVAKKMADGFGPAAAAEAAAAQPNDPAGLKKALDALRADGKAAAAAPHAKLAAVPFKTFDEQVALATKGLADKDNAAAAKALAAAAKALAEAKAIQAGHAQFVGGLGAVEAALKALKASKRAAKIQGRIAPIEAALAEAKAKDEAHDALAAMSALRRANDAVAAGKAADHDRGQFDTRVAPLDKRIEKVADGTERGQLQAMSTAAVAKADAFAFADAGKALDAIEVRLDKGQLEALMAAKPGDPQIAKMAARMVGKGGASTVDAMIQAIPDGGDMKLLNGLAEGRYGIKFKNDPPLPPLPPGSPGFPAGRPAGDPAKAMKVICDMFSKIPQDIVKNKSITSVSYEDAFRKAGGGYQPSDGSISMNGRAGAIKQRFGANQENQDPVSKAWVKQLPPDIEEDCKPVNDNEVEYLSFAAAHEVGHGMDDSTGFMAQHGSQAKYGGWVSFGSSVQPLADIVGAHADHAAFYKTAEQKRYVLDRLQNKPATPPAATTPAETNALQAFHNWLGLATAPNVYRRQGDCDAIKIGTMIYHEAYPRIWVGYLADARKKALTGYQFRAPGEWFAELYAGFRSGKLKDTHPAMEWLKKL